MKISTGWAIGLVGAGWWAAGGAHAARLAEVRPLDESTLVVHVLDSQGHYQDDGKGKTAFQGHESRGDGDWLEVFGEPLDVARAVPGSFALSSADDPDYALPAAPDAVFRKSKVGRTPWGWPEPKFALEHTLFVRLPRPMTPGRTYRLRLDPSLRVDRAESSWTYDPFAQISDAVHVNLVGYHPAIPVKSADLYAWMGDGGARDYSAYVGRRVYLIRRSDGERTEVGRVAHGSRPTVEFTHWDLTKSDVWTIDFDAFAGSGTYRLAVEGVGCSPDFRLGADAYRKPFATSLLGFYFMRIGEPKDFAPVPRQPRFIPGRDPAGFRVVRTTFGPFHPDWRSVGGDPWDFKDWSKWAEPGEPTNPDAYGGHSDALDWDRHFGHVTIIYDLLSPYLLSAGRLSDDDTGIRESGNGIPDLIDEAANEADFWFRLRDGQGGFSTGLNNPSQEHTLMYQAAAAPVMAWANAANQAMMADAYRLAGRAAESRAYAARAQEAWRIAGGRDLDVSFDAGGTTLRGRDLKFMAAAFLYNATGEAKWEAEMAAEAAVTPPSSGIEVLGKHGRLWGTAAYLMAAREKWRPIRHPELVAAMREALVAEAVARHVDVIATRASRRSSDDGLGWFQSRQEVQRACVAHAVAEDPAVRGRLLRALVLEADYGLGRNPMNHIQMTGMGPRGVDDIYTSGWNDGHPGVHPGHTPYMNANNWGQGFMADPQWYAARGYPEWAKWPHGEALWPARYSYANNEFTPQQQMRGKMALYGYLWSLGARR